MLGGVAELQTLGYAARLSLRKGLVERRHPMRVQIVQAHSDHGNTGVSLIHQPAHLMGEVLHGAPFRDLHMPPPEPVEGPASGSRPYSLKKVSSLRSPTSKSTQRLPSLSSTTAVQIQTSRRFPFRLAPT